MPRDLPTDLDRDVRRVLDEASPGEQMVLLTTLLRSGAKLGAFRVYLARLRPALEHATRGDMQAMRDKGWTLATIELRYRIEAWSNQGSD